MKNRRLYIAGAGALGRELESILDKIPLAQREWSITGFLSDVEEALDGYPSDYSIIGPIHGFEFGTDDLVIIAVADPQGRKQVFEYLQDRVEIFTFISPEATVGKFVKIGRGCILGPRVVIGPNVTLGDAVFINSGSMVGHDTTIESYTSLMANNNIAGRCHIGEGAYLASTVTIIPKRRICAGAMIGAGSVVINHIKERRTVFGNPAKYI